MRHLGAACGSETLNSELSRERKMHCSLEEKSGGQGRPAVFSVSPQELQENQRSLRTKCAGGREKTLGFLMKFRDLGRLFGSESKNLRREDPSDYRGQVQILSTV